MQQNSKKEASFTEKIMNDSLQTKIFNNMHAATKIYKFLALSCIICSIALARTYAEGIVSVGSSGSIKSIIHFSSTGDLLYTTLNLLRDVIYFVRLVLN
jgi:hypothetical protein